VNILVIPQRRRRLEVNPESATRGFRFDLLISEPNHYSPRLAFQVENFRCRQILAVVRQ
jgi:hypothetical protein